VLLETSIPQADRLHHLATIEVQVHLTTDRLLLLITKDRQVLLMTEVQLQADQTTTHRDIAPRAEAALVQVSVLRAGVPEVAQAVLQEAALQEDPEQGGEINSPFFLSTHLTQNQLFPVYTLTKQTLNEAINSDFLRFHNFGTFRFCPKWIL
jgi:hypothetical protein